MNREDLIKKWLDNNLNSQEQQAFEALDDYNALTKLDRFAKGFSAPEFDSEATFKNIVAATNSSKKSTNWITYATKIAAMLVISFGFYFLFYNTSTEYQTDYAEKTAFTLPDNSAVSLNAQSQLSFNKKNWNTKRDVNLTGEAYFKVEKGSTFNVITQAGTITVLGTQFNVKERSNYFEVTCYEGSVKVTHTKKTIVLKPGDSFVVLNNEIINKNTNNTAPSWIKNTSEFKSVPLQQVINELEIQYNITINTKNIDTNKLFTGKFTHTNLEVALQSVTIPLSLKYSKNNNTITLTRE